MVVCLIVDRAVNQIQQNWRAEFNSSDCPMEQEGASGGAKRARTGPIFTDDQGISIIEL